MLGVKVARLSTIKYSKTIMFEWLRIKKSTEKPPTEIPPEVDEIDTIPLSAPKVAEGKIGGTFVFGTDKGFNYKKYNEDAVVVDPESMAFAVIDGMGGMGAEKSGQQATNILAEEFQKVFEGLEETNGSESFKEIFETAIGKAQESARERMKSDGRVGEGGAVYVAAKIHKNEMHIAHMGDAKLVVIGQDGAIRFATQDHNLANEKQKTGLSISPEDKAFVTRAVRGVDAFDIEFNKIILQKGDRVIVASDGLWDNLEPEEVLSITSSKNIKEAFAQLDAETKLRMQRDDSSPDAGKPDNRSLIIFDYLPPKVPAAV